MKVLTIKQSWVTLIMQKDKRLSIYLSDELPIEKNTWEVDNVEVFDNSIEVRG